MPRSTPLTLILDPIRMTSHKSNASTQIRLGNEIELISIAQSFPSVHLFVGFGERAQYSDPEEVICSLDPHLQAIQTQCHGEVGTGSTAQAVL